MSYSLRSVIRFHKQLLYFRNPFRLPRKLTKCTTADRPGNSFQGLDMVVRRFGRRHQQEKDVDRFTVQASKINSSLADSHGACCLGHTWVFCMRGCDAMPHSSTPQFLAIQDDFDQAINVLTTQLSCVQQSLGQFANNPFSIRCFQFKSANFIRSSHHSVLSCYA